MKLKVEQTNSGQTLHIEIPFKERVAFRLPKNCLDCPVGYMNANCGRSYPFSDENYEKRPDNCTLKLISLDKFEEILRNINIGDDEYANNI